MDTSEATSASPLTRRRILGWSGIGIMAGVTGYMGWPRLKNADSPAAASSTTTRAGSVPPEPAPPAGPIRREDFLPHVNSEFQLEAPSPATTCKLIEVSAAESLVSPTARFTSFSLLFSAPKDFAAESQIHRLSHARMETMELFLSPVGKSGERVYLEAVFSQRV